MGNFSHLTEKLQTIRRISNMPEVANIRTSSNLNPNFVTSLFSGISLDAFLVGPLLGYPGDFSKNQCLVRIFVLLTVFNCSLVQFSSYFKK